ncbi:MAG: ATP-binding protein [Pseudomonadota bacterium]|nr:ATP-binding protein [Pseudomonadota bacterium]
MPQRAQAELAVAGHELSALADNLPNPAWIAHADGSIFWYNRAWYDYTGATPDEMMGWGWSAVHHPDELARVTAEWAATLATGSTFEMTFPLRRHDGAFRPFLTRVVPIRDASDAIVRWFGTKVDISAQIETEDRLRVAEADWRTLFDEMQEGIAVIELQRDSRGVVVDAIVRQANSYHERFTGVPLARSIGTSVFARAPDAAAFLLPIYVRVAETGFSEQHEVHSKVLGRWGDVRAYRHSPDKVAVLFSDVTPRKDAEQEARRAQESLLRVSRLSAMGAMASTLAHELNQPIGAASNFIAAADQHVLRNATPDPALLRGLFGNAIASCQRAGDIIRSMLDFTITGEVAKAPWNVRELIDAAVEEYLGTRPSAAVAFDIRCPATLPPLPCDRVQISQVLRNLFTNSVQAMTGVTPKAISIAARATAQSIELRVEDQGHGFRERSHEQLFEPFWSTTDLGLGLGLPLCRTIVEAHGGSIRAEPAPGGGAAFVIQLPLLDG